MGRQRIDTEDTVSRMVRPFENLHSPITINQRFEVILSSPGRIPGAHVDDAHVLKDVESLEIRLVQIVNLFRNLSYPRLDGTVQQLGHDFHVAVSLSERLHELADPV